MSAADPADHDCLVAAREGALDGFETVYRRHANAVLAFLMRRTRNPELAADVFAEAFASLLALVVAEKERPIPTTPLAWLLTAANNLLIDAHRRGQVEMRARARLKMEPLLLDDSDLQLIEEIETETDLLQELTKVLPPDQVAAVKARVLDGEDYPTIATRLRCSEAVARKRVSRAMQTLRHTSKEANNRA
jgi:RNA polymerase sigma factor (sigma-70 family)